MKQCFSYPFYILVIAGLLCPALLPAQTKVLKVQATNANNYGVEYTLPKTVLRVHAEYTITKQTAGQYAQYASKYLGISESEVIKEDGQFCALGKITVESVGIPDRNESYLVEFKSKTTAPFVYLTENGLLCTINAEYTPEEKKAVTNPATASGEVKAIDPHSIFTEEYLRAGSVSKMAEVLAKQIFRIRESRNDILTGEADNAPRDGEGIRIVLSNLEAQEKALLALFTGTSVTETRTAQFEIEPQSNIEKEILFRFSKFLGVVEADDLSGSPVYLNVTQTEPAAEPIDAAKSKNMKESIVYNIPSNAKVELFYGLQSVFQGEFPIVQFGTKQMLAKSVFEDKKTPVKIYFYPNTGAIKQIIQ